MAEKLPVIHQVAVVIYHALKKQNRQTRDELEAPIAKAGVLPQYFPHAVRLLRDTFGDNALVTVYDEEHGTSPIYVLDPNIDEAQDWMVRMLKRAITESEHVMGTLDWAAQSYGNKGPIRKARHYQKNVIVELEEVLASLDN